MSFPFNPKHNLIIARTEIEGPTGTAVLRLALDTGATGTLINAGMLVSIGYDPALTPDRVQITTGSGVEFVPHLAVSTIGRSARNATVFRFSVTRYLRARVSMASLGWTSCED